MLHNYIDMEISVKYFIYNLSITNNKMPKRKSTKACFINNAISLLRSTNVYVPYLQFMNVALYSELIRERFRGLALGCCKRSFFFFTATKLCYISEDKYEQFSSVLRK
jgi:hypothetical protein